MFGSRWILSFLQFLYPRVKIFWKLIKAEPSNFDRVFFSVCCFPQGSQISSEMWLFKASQCFLLSLDSFLGCGFSQLRYILANFCISSAPYFSCQISCLHRCCMKAYCIICKICLLGFLNESFWPGNVNDRLGRQLWVSSIAFSFHLHGKPSLTCCHPIKAVAPLLI